MRSTALFLIPAILMTVSSGTSAATPQAPASSPSQGPATPAPAAAPAGMTQYYMVFLRRGPAWTATVTPETTKVSQGHMANIQRLTKEGLMVVAGPFDGQTGERALAGIFVLRVGSMEEARKVTESDPAVRAGRFVYEIAPWWGPTSLRY